MHLLIPFKLLFHWTLSSIYKEFVYLSFFNSQLHLVSAEVLMTISSVHADSY